MGPAAAWIERDVVDAVGDEATTYLQGQLSQDIAALAKGASAWSLLLEPNGKVTAWLRVTRTGADAFVLDVDSGAGELVVARLERFKLRTRCTFTLREHQPVLAVRGSVLGDGGGAPIAWPETEGYDLMGPSATVPDGAEMLDAQAYEALRIEHGVPVSAVDITTETIPAEAGGWLIEASVSFTKGCYTGQELVARVDSRGSNVPRPLRRLRVEGPDADLLGATVSTTEGVAVGRVSSAAYSVATRTAVALAPIGRALAVPGPVLVAGREATALP
ncbi:MAG: YgfZ/GcvT domain-containing protein [Acidimicrobiales bacterium]